MVDRQPVSVEDFTLYPLFTDDLIDLMRSLIPPEEQAKVATAVVVRGRTRPTGRRVGLDERLLPQRLPM